MWVQIDKISQYVDKEVTIKGWLYNIRSAGKLMFPELRDGSGLIQGVVSKKEVSESVWDDFQKLTQESSVIVTGMVTKHPKKEDVYELQINNLEIVSIADPYPITPKEHGVDFLSEKRHLWLRSPRQASILRIRNEIIMAIRTYMYENDFILFNKDILLEVNKVEYRPILCEKHKARFLILENLSGIKNCNIIQNNNILESFSYNVD